MIISINNYNILINQLRIINVHEVITKSACCIEKNRRDVNMKRFYTGFLSRDKLSIA